LFGTPKNHFNTFFAAQAVGVKEVHDDIWLVSFMDYDLQSADTGGDRNQVHPLRFLSRRFVEG
jgi:putative transposase